MKKILITLLTITLILGGLGVAAFYIGTNMASEKMVDDFSGDPDQKEQLRNFVENDPELSQMVREVEQIDSSTLPFQTKEEATRVLIRKVGLSELMEIQTQLERGTASLDEVLKSLERDLTEEEIKALKVVAYKELYK
ncbi:hypothetical protein [Bacillus sp. FJAT-45037]|uniref:hypothetical protein n=1 Tax=Bacillus sp. FJAT-45037 TaxID=2011007 RepID=UPI000C249D30|nr:hypothetical protein [Bacillus sp. FJAT-45037]